MNRLFKTLAPAGVRARLSVLGFHRVLREPDPLRPGEPDVAAFEARLHWVKAWFNVLPLAAAIRGLKTGKLPERPLALTFDDGYADNHDLALPVLSRLGLPATFFIATGYLDGGRMFNDTVIEAIRQAPGEALDLADLDLGIHNISSVTARRAAITSLLPRLKYFPVVRRAALAGAIAERSRAQLPDDLMMTAAQVTALHAAGMEIGGHTVSHPILATLPLNEARAEIAEGRARLEAITGAPVRLFAYPNGNPARDYRREHAALLRELGFEGAVTSAWGAARGDSDVFQLPRFTPWDRARLPFGLRLAQNLMRQSHACA